VDPTTVAKEIWPGRPLVVEELGGGITNRNFKVTVDGDAFVLRLGGKDTELLGIDRDVEHGASLVAAAAGIGPEVVAFLGEGWLVTRFIQGRPVPPEEMRRERLAEAAAALRLIHEVGHIPGHFDAFRVVEAYHDTAAAHGVAIPAAYHEAKAVADAIERARGPQPKTPCHNDLLNANFLDERGRLWIVDWEYAGMGDRFFDLANFSVNHELPEADESSFLAAYAGKTSDEDVRALRLMRFMSDFREAMWGVVQQGISELDFDFADYAMRHFARLERTAAEPRFQQALTSA
jgi:thiamine kinase-like enzyme